MRDLTVAIAFTLSGPSRTIALLRLAIVFSPGGIAPWRKIPVTILRTSSSVIGQTAQIIDASAARHCEDAILKFGANALG